MTRVSRSRDEVVSWLRASLASELRINPATIGADRALTFYGLDSLTAATIAGDFADWLGHPLPDNVLSAQATINSLADRFAGPHAAKAIHHRVLRRQRSSDRRDYARLDYRRSPPFERFAKVVIRGLVKVTTDLRVEGLEKVPLEGPILLASNHLHILDAVWMLGVLPRRMIMLVAEEFERKPIVNWLLIAARVVFISRSTADRVALDQALMVLERGGVLAVAPEGKLSRTGGLIRGHSGIAYIATQSGVPVTPAVLWGQEKTFACWFRLRRVHVELRFGDAAPVPAGPAGPRELRHYTDDIMRSLAALLPPAYRGVYAK